MSFMNLVVLPMLSQLLQVHAAICVVIGADASVGVRIPTFEICVTSAVRTAEEEPASPIVSTQPIPKSSAMLYVTVVASPLHPLVDPFIALRARHRKEHMCTVWLRLDLRKH